jgi:uncharacterized RDD family membrane protein YckC
MAVYGQPVMAAYPPPPPPGALPFPLAGLFERAVAVIVDTILLIIVGAIIVVPIVLLFLLSAPVILGVFSVLELLLIGFVFLLGLGYFTYFEMTSGQTIGKRLMHIRVIDPATGNPPAMEKALIRNLLRIIDGLFIYLIGLIIALTNDKKQRLGDMLAGTVVIRA